MKKPARVQILFSFLLLALTEVLYRGFPVEGFNHPFIANENFGTWLDLQYGGAELEGHWVSFNAIPTTAHTIWGVPAGQLLMSNRSKRQKWSGFLRLVGKNSLFIYLFAHIGGAILLESIIHPFTFLLFGWMGALTASILTSLVVLFLLWYLCDWLNRHKIFIKI